MGNCKKVGQKFVNQAGRNKQAERIKFVNKAGRNKQAGWKKSMKNLREHALLLGTSEYFDFENSTSVL